MTTETENQLNLAHRDFFDRDFFEQSKEIFNKVVVLIENEIKKLKDPEFDAISKIMVIHEVLKKLSKTKLDIFFNSIK